MLSIEETSARITPGFFWSKGDVHRAVNVTDKARLGRDAPGDPQGMKLVEPFHFVSPWLLFRMRNLFDDPKAVVSGMNPDDLAGLRIGLAVIGTGVAGKLAETCALLTSAVKAEREEGKARVREYRTVGVSHAKPSAVE